MQTHEFLKPATVAMTGCIAKLLVASVLIANLAVSNTTYANVAAAEKPNVLIITVDDMSADSLGVFGCKLPETSPNIDALAHQGMRFNKAHVVVGNCFPSRNVMWSGLYPHNTGVEGFYQVRDASHLHLADLTQQAGYFTGIQHKVGHSTPYSPYPSWDVDLDTDHQGRKRDIKAAKSYFDGTSQGIQQAKNANKPFCMVINVSDPHKPFFAEGKGGATVPDKNVPSKVFTAADVPVPGFLFDDPVVRKELAHYYSSVRRADDCVGAILKALDESGQRDNTIIMFLSDHGMPLPFAKTQVYHHSSHTPLCLIVPGVTSADTVDSTHMVSAVDLLPTLLELTNIKHPKRMDGRSFASLLKGETQHNRDYIIKEYSENAGGSRDPMRSVQTEKHLYIFNPWSNGSRIMATATTGTPTYRRMAELAKTDEQINARHDLYQHRVPEELYDIQRDPDCLVNLINSAEHQPELTRLTSILEKWMQDTGDNMLPVFQNRTDAAVREAYVVAQEAEAEARKGGKSGKGKQQRQQTGKRPAKVNYISFADPAAVVADKQVTVSVAHKLPKQLGEQVFTITLKSGNQGQRIDRKTVTASGIGSTTVTFDLPATPPAEISFAAFIGDDFPTSIQHVQSGVLATGR